MKKPLLWGAAVILFVVALAVVWFVRMNAIISGSESCMNQEHLALVSPDGKWKAVVAEPLCRMGATTAETRVVTLQQTGSAKATPAIVAAVATDRDPTIEWTAPDRLRIGGFAPAEYFERQDTASAVHIEYVAATKPGRARKRR